MTAIPLFMQDSSYSAEDTRALMDALVRTEGVFGKVQNHCHVTERGAGTDWSVDVSAGFAAVEGDDEPGQGKYLCKIGATNIAIGAAPSAGNSRIDLVTLQVNDSAILGGSDEVTVTVVAGTPGSSPSAPSLPNSALLLATVTVADTDTEILDANITDERSDVVLGSGPYPKLYDIGAAALGSAPDPLGGAYMEQAGYEVVTTNGSGRFTITFPSAFPNGVIGVWPQLGPATALNGLAFTVYSISVTQFVVAVRDLDNVNFASISGIPVVWRALGF